MARSAAPDDETVCVSRGAMGAGTAPLRVSPATLHGWSQTASAASAARNSNTDAWRRTIATEPTRPRVLRNRTRDADAESGQARNAPHRGRSRAPRVARRA